MKNYDVLVVGAGMAGIYSVYRMKENGLAVHAIEAGGGVGGTWFWNTYPGARCDVESLDYSFSFSEELQSETRWSERFAAQPEILQYLNNVVDRFGLRENITCNARANVVRYDQSTRRWTVETDGATYSAKYLIMATGLLSVPVEPSIPGLDAFGGEIYSTGRWPASGVDLKDKRIALFGNGSSGVQVLPTVAKEAESVTLFQRTAGYAIPMRNDLMTDAEFEEAVAAYSERRKRTKESAMGTYWSAYHTSDESLFGASEEERRRVFEKFWDMGGPGFVVAFADILLDMDANKLASDFVRDKIRELVRDPETAEKLVPAADEPIGCKRLCVENGYFEAFNRPNVSVVDLRAEPIGSFGERAIHTADNSHDIDVVILATGFDAFTGSMLRMDVQGRGIALRDKWDEGPSNYLGMLMAGFPNMFTVNGPGTVAANFFLATEVQVDWIGRLIGEAEKRGASAIETDVQGEREWRELLDSVAEMVTVTNHCETWFRGTNVAGKPKVVMNYLGGLGGYSEYCDGVELEGYRHLRFQD
ncbi:flavin-containing monooxygenase [Rhodococcus opacus]|uniref:flavin-containing monooxygenase n=1 Tax=Rhodococcus opacus TaxID=37919 RepID=UPI0024735003|nr:NAD(P)/FAD-dependent oxidoreductase [Rhodococcus opacus]MDH6291984.1 cyclohexanone monooxygenase [Rhodococcus opacus]